MSDRRFQASSVRGGLLLKLVLVLAALAAMAAIAWVVLLPSLIVSAVRDKTGFVLQIDQLSANPFTGKVHVSGLVLKNPADWPRSDFVQLRRFELQTSLTGLFGDRFVADDLVIDAAQIAFVRNHDGQLNVNVFRKGFAGPDTASAAAPEAKSAPSAAGTPSKFLIHHLSLKLDQLVFADYTGREPRIKEYKLGLSRELYEVDSIAKLVDPLAGATLRPLADTLTGILKHQNGLRIDSPISVDDALDALESAGRKTGAGLKSLIQSLEKKKP